MKFNKSILTVALGLSLTGLSQAGTVYFTGSTAMRNSTYNALITPGLVFTAAPTFAGDGAGALTGTTPNKDTYMNFSGTLVGGSGTTLVKCHWSGSEAGILDICSNSVVQEQFMLDTASGDSSNNIISLTTPQNVDLAMADNLQTYSRTKKPTLANGTKVGVITFAWVRNNGLWQGSNVSDVQIQQALGGACPIAVFSGSNDLTSFVYVTGRDFSSGTRVNAFGDSGFGILNSPNQVEVNSSGVMQDINSDGTYEGDFGYSSGGSVASALKVNTTSATDLTPNGPATGFSLIGYVGISDAGTASGSISATGPSNTGPGYCLSYNGVPFSVAGVVNGQYSFWGNEYVYQSPNAGTEAQKVYNNFKVIASGHDTIFDNVTAINLDKMHCSRTGPTAIPTHN